MVEIISKGQVPGEKEYNCTCGNCKTLFKFKRKEATERSNNGWGGGVYLSIRCPLEGCGRECTVSADAYIKSSYSSSQYWDR